MTSRGSRTLATDRNARCSSLMERVFLVTVNVALDRMSLELLSALNSTGQGSTTTSSEIPVGEKTHRHHECHSFRSIGFQVAS